jgi:hypothetical protein
MSDRAFTSIGSLSDGPIRFGERRHILVFCIDGEDAS